LQQPTCDRKTLIAPTPCKGTIGPCRNKNRNEPNSANESVNVLIIRKANTIRYDVQPHYAFDTDDYLVESFMRGWRMFVRGIHNFGRRIRHSPNLG
jgi:hypothetical protein